MFRLSKLVEQGRSSVRFIGITLDAETLRNLFDPNNGQTILPNSF